MYETHTHTHTHTHTKAVKINTSVKICQGIHKIKGCKITHQISELLRGKE